ncbi:MAG: hypothetical protein P8I38_00345 [Arenicella sp.]|jgi:GDP-D-mannose dehydratase|nr:hypothetical protein [Arenicella sp.]
MLHHGDLSDDSTLIRFVREVEPGEICSLVVQGHFAVLFEVSVDAGRCGCAGYLTLVIGD